MEQNSPIQSQRRTRTGVGLPVLLALMGVAVSAMAQEPASRAHADASEDKIVAMAEKRYHAKVVRVEEGDHKGRRVYVLRLLSREGRVWTVKVDPETGKEL